MQLSIDTISKKYAEAFLNLFLDQVSDKNLEKWIKLELFLKKNKLFYIYLRIPTISNFEKQKSILKICSVLSLDKPIKKIMLLLLDSGRIEILDRVLNKIILLYRRKKNIKFFKVLTPCEISSNERKKIIDFIESISSCLVLAEFIKDEKLIAGLRIQSSTFLWERSIAKQLRNVKRSIFKQVGLW